MDVTEELKAAIATTQARHAVYKDGYKRQIAVLHALFPEGFAADSIEGWTNLWFLFTLTTKLTRYAVSLEDGKPHLDSAHDLGVYAFMAEKSIKEKPPEVGPLKHADPVAQALMNIADPALWSANNPETRRQARLALSLYLQQEAIAQMGDAAFKTWCDAHRAAVLDEGSLSSREPYPSNDKPCGKFNGNEFGHCTGCGWSLNDHIVESFNQTRKQPPLRDVKACNRFRSHPAKVDICFGCGWRLDLHGLDVQP